MLRESAVNVLESYLKGNNFRQSLPLVVQHEAGSATRSPALVLYEAEPAVKRKIESTFDLLPSSVFCVVLSFMASLSNSKLHLEKV